MAYQVRREEIATQIAGSWPRTAESQYYQYHILLVTLTRSKHEGNHSTPNSYQDLSFHILNPPRSGLSFPASLSRSVTHVQPRQSNYLPILQIEINTTSNFAAKRTAHVIPIPRHGLTTTYCYQLLAPYPILPKLMSQKPGVTHKAVQKNFRHTDSPHRMFSR
jgi:hypothetical protein